MKWFQSIKNFYFVKSTDLNSIELKRVIVTNITITLCFFLSLFISITLFYLEIYPLDVTFAFLACLYLACWQISITGNYLTAKIILYCVLLSQCICTSVILGKNVDLRIFYITTALVPLLIFGKKERRFLYISIFITIINISLVHFTRNSYNPYYSYDPASYEYINMTLNAICIVCLLVMSFVFLFLTEAGEEEAQKLNFELLSNQQKLISSEEELKRINHLKDHLLKIMTHDLKSPLNNISAMAELMLNEKITKDEIRFLSERFKQTAENTSLMLDNILAWSIRQIDKKDPERFILPSLVNKVFSQLEDKAEAKKIKLLNQIPSRLYIKSDPEMLEILLRNLVGNSIKFCHEGGQVRVDAAIINQRILIRVEDNGIGIPPSLLNNLFGTNRLSSRPGTQQEKGSGIGLLLCQHLIQSAQGHLNIQSEEKRFTIVTIDLPNH